MFSNLRRHLGTAGLLVAVVALVAALGGGAVAAQSGGDATASAKKKKRAAGLNGKQKRQVIGLIKRNGGGPAGPAGPAGPQGIQGLQGGQGLQGLRGGRGDDGDPGDHGTSVTVTEEPPLVGNCDDPGGWKLDHVDGVDYVCHGEDGQDGDNSPFADSGGTLPTGTTLTGAFSLDLGIAASSGDHVRLPISFPIPLSAPLAGADPGAGDGCYRFDGSFIGPCEVHYIKANGKEVALNVGTFSMEEFDSDHCFGTADNPTAVSGHLCVYEAFAEEISFASEVGVLISQLGDDPVIGGASVSGAIIKATTVDASAPNRPKLIGSWAVTG